MNTEDKPEDVLQQIRNSIVRLLARREHSCVELYRKLKQKGFEADDINQSLAPYIEKGLQSDYRYAEVFVRSSFEKGKGPAYIEQSLQLHDIDALTTKALIDDQAFDWYSSAAKVRQKRFGQSMPSEWNDVQKQKRFLQYRGFYQAHIKEVFG